MWIVMLPVLEIAQNNIISARCDGQDFFSEEHKKSNIHDLTIIIKFMETEKCFQSVMTPTVRNSSWSL